MSETNIKIPWAGWHIVGELGEGGYGRVYEIERKQSSISERAALKVISIPKSKTEYQSIRFSMDTDEELESYFEEKKDRVLREIETLQRLKGCANVLDIDDWAIVDKEDGPGWDIYIRMELLQNLLTAFQGGVATEADVIEIGKDICTALERCEKRNIVHRDIKPQNILVSQGKDYKLTDFGIARTLDHTTNMTGVGTPPYMSPEVYNGDEADKTVDMYSLGLVMYELLNNRRLPFVPKGFSQLDLRNAINRRMSGEKIPEPANGSPELKKVILKACAFDPKDRYSSASEMKNDIIRAEKGIKENASSAAWNAGNIDNTTEPEPEMTHNKYRAGRGKDEKTEKAENAGWHDASETVGAEELGKERKNRFKDFTKTAAADDLGRNKPPKKASAGKSSAQKPQGKTSAKSKQSGAASTPINGLRKEKKSHTAKRRNKDRAERSPAVRIGYILIILIVVTSAFVFVISNPRYDVDDGESFNKCIKYFAGDDYESTSGKTSVKAICRSEDKPSFMRRTRIFKDENPDDPVYMWYEDGTVYYYCEAEKIVLPASTSFMFDGCSSLTELDLSSFDTGSVTSMYGMFSGCNSLTKLDLSNFDTSAVTGMGGMFRGCSSLTELDLSSFDTSSVKNMSGMFEYCSSLTKLDLSNFETGSVEDMSWMFYNCFLLKADCYWDVRNVKEHKVFNNNAPGVIEPKWIN